MRNEEPVKEGLFFFSIKLLRYANGELDWDMDMKNTGVIQELVIAQLRALLNTLEKDYFDNFDQTSSKLKSDQ